MDLIYFILSGVAIFLALWFFFINVIQLKKYKDSIPKLLIYPLYLFAAVGYIIDVLFNWIYGTIIFCELPRQLTLSERLREILIIRSPNTKRFKIAYFMCHYMIEPWDYNHCGLLGR